MRIMALSLGLLLLASNAALAQSTTEDGATIQVERVSKWPAILKGAIIGGTIGAFVGIKWVDSECGGGHCPASDYVGGAAYLGGLGALVGGAIGVDFALRPAVGHRPGISAIFSRRRSAAVLSVRF